MFPYQSETYTLHPAEHLVVHRDEGLRHGARGRRERRLSGERGRGGRERAPRRPRSALTDLTAATETRKVQD